jgi:hypothetical protein
LAELVALTEAQNCQKNRQSTSIQILSMPSWSYMLMQPSGRKEEC